MNARNENLSVRLPEQIREQVDALAKATRRSRSFIINDAVVTYLKGQAEYVEGIEKAINSMEEERGHRAETVHAWLDEWANGNKQPLPSPETFGKR
jgi:predicted transcriptional regulator